MLSLEDIKYLKEQKYKGSYVKLMYDLRKYPKGGTINTLDTGEIEYNTKSLEEWNTRHQAYQDSLRVYNDYNRIRQDLQKQDYNSPGTVNTIIKANRDWGPRSLLDRTFSNYKTYQKILETNLQLAPYIPIQYKDKFGINSVNKDRDEYSMLDLDPRQINSTIKSQLFNTKIKPIGTEFWVGTKGQGIGDYREIYNYENAKPKTYPVYDWPSTPTNTTKPVRKQIKPKVVQEVPVVPKPIQRVYESELTPTFNPTSLWGSSIKNTQDPSSFVIGDMTGNREGKMLKTPITYKEATDWNPELKKKHGIDAIEQYFKNKNGKTTTK